MATTKFIKTLENCIIMREDDMTKSNELGTITGILERTPQIQPYYNEVKSAVAHLQDGDGSDYPIFELVHGHVSAIASAGNLPVHDWEIKQVNGGRIVAHRDFLNIQNEFSSLELPETAKLAWDSDRCMDAFQDYIEKKTEFRRRHISLFQQGLKNLDEKSRQIVLLTAQERFPQLMTASDDMSIVAMPSWLDNHELWAGMGITTELTSRIPSWVKIYEIGVVLASRDYRDDKPKGHDYFSYAARAAVKGEVHEVSQKLSLTAQHEGSHGIVDATLIYLLGVDAYNPVGEGIPGSLGDDGRGLKHTNITLQQLLDNPCPEGSNLKNETAYVAGSKLWDSVIAILQQRGLLKDDAWAEVFRASLESAVKLSSDDKFKSQEKKIKVASLIQATIKSMNITIEQIEPIYQSLNIDF